MNNPKITIELIQYKTFSEPKYVLSINFFDGIGSRRFWGGFDKDQIEDQIEWAKRQWQEYEIEVVDLSNVILYMT
jgi:hypothetical protein